jgi:hypothetical protein
MVGVMEFMDMFHHWIMLWVTWYCFLMQNQCERIMFQIFS